MGKYKRKSIVIEAYEWTGTYNEKDCPKWLITAMQKPGIEYGAARIVGNVIKMVSDTSIQTAHRGDYIIRGPEGELYPCNPHVFNLLHDSEEA